MKSFITYFITYFIFLTYFPLLVYTIDLTLKFNFCSNELGIAKEYLLSEIKQLENKNGKKN